MNEDKNQDNVEEDDEHPPVIDFMPIIVGNEALLEPDEEDPVPVFVDETKRGLLKETLNLSWPLILRNIVQGARDFSSIYTLSKLTEADVGGFNLAYMLIASVTLVEGAFFVPVQNMVAHLYTRRAYKDIGSIMQQAWLLGFLVSIPSMYIYRRGEWFLIKLGQPEDAAAAAGSFLQYYMYSTFAVRWTEADLALLPAIKKEKSIIVWTTCVQLLGFVLNISLIPNYGIEGAGCAALIENGSGIIFLTLYFMFSRDFRPYALFNLRILSGLNYLKSILKHSFALVFLSLLQIPVIMLKGSMTGWLGTRALFLDGIISQVTSLSSGIVTRALTQGSSILISQAIGLEPRKENLHRNLLVIGLKAALVFPILITIIYAFASPTIYDGFSQSSESDDTKNEPQISVSDASIRITFLIFGLNNLMDTMNAMLVSGLQGICDFNYPGTISFLTQVFIALPAGYFYAFVLGIDLSGIYLGAVTGFIVNNYLIYKRWGNLSNNDRYLDQARARENDTGYSLSSLFAAVKSVCTHCKKRARRVEEDRPILGNEMKVNNERRVRDGEDFRLIDFQRDNSMLDRYFRSPIN